MRRIQILILIVLAILVTCVIQPATAQGNADTRVDVVLVIDNSGSMEENDPQNMRISAAKLFASLMLEGDQIGIVSLGDRDSTRTDLSLKSPRVLTKDTWSLAETVRAPDQLANYTYMGQALDLAGQVLENTARFNKQRAVLFLTDGKATARPEDQASEEQKISSSVAEFQAQGIKVFPIALGAEADVPFLQDRIAAPTNGRLWQAATPDALIKVYAEILTTLQDGRYLDEYPVLAGGDAFLANVNARQQIRQVNYVFPNQGNPPEITNWRLPRGAGGDRVGKFDDPNWSMFVADPGFIPEFTGEWRMTLNSDQAQVPMIAVIKSDLRARLIEPTPSTPEDEASIRYYPAGRPLLLRAGARDIADRFVKGTGLFVQMQQPQPWDGMTLIDEGNAQDTKPADGMYAGMYTEPMTPGTYQLLVNASPTENHLLLKKYYTLIVEPLPTMQVKVVPDGQLQEGEPVRIQASFALNDQAVEVDAAEIEVAVQFEDQTIGTVQLAERNGVWEGEYLPDRAATFSFDVTAHVDWTKPDGSPRRYTDFVEVDYGASVQPLVELAVLEADEQSGNLSRGIQRTVQFRSYADQPVTLDLRVAGLPEGSVFPTTLQIGPRETGKRTVTITAPETGSSGEVQARLLVEGSDNLRLNTTELPITVQVPSFLTRHRYGLIALGALLFVVSRRKTRQRMSEFVGRNVEILRYGGR